MLYRTLGKTGLKVSILGFGAMRLPMEGDAPPGTFDPAIPVDERKAVDMIKFAVAHGVNYFDSAYMYHNGKSEVILGKGLKGQRDKVLVATKLPVVLARAPEDFDKFINEQLTRLATDYLDIYLLHGLDRGSWPRVRDMGILQFLDRIKADGRARHVGFSFHDDVRAFKEIVESHDWDLCQIQYNYLDEHYQAGREGLVYAASKGLGVVVMEPVRGGRLAEPVPDDVKTIWSAANIKRSPAEWALRWVWNHPEVSTVLSGMSTMEQVVENVRTADEGKENSLSEKELRLIDEAAKAYRKMFKVDCTGCAYCMPCKEGIAVPMIFSAYNDLFISKQNAQGATMLYNMFMSPERRASACIECGECEEKCPQHISIRDELKAAHEALFRPDLKRG
ncbi:MAG: aldo/keto reductase [Syntrophorhabdales bacterium]|jgi:predicted aldo/keto reductase-like oxidoreductase